MPPAGGPGAPPPYITDISTPPLRDPRSLVKMTQRWSRESLVAEDVPATCDLSAMAEGLGSILIEIRTKSSTLWRVS